MNFCQINVSEYFVIADDAQHDKNKKKEGKKKKKQNLITARAMERERLYKIFAWERLFGDFCVMHLYMRAHAPADTAGTRAFNNFFSRVYIFPAALVQ